MSLSQRARLRPVVYPVAILVGFVLFDLVRTGVSPYAAGRPLMIALALGLALPWLFGLLVGDRHRAGVLAAIVVMLLLAGQQPAAVVLLLVVFVLVLAEPRIVSAGRQGIRWPLITRTMTAVAAIVFLAIGIFAVQTGRAVDIPRDLVAESPLGGATATARAAAPELPTVVLLLLDGYPRADKLRDELGIDDGALIGGLRDQGFVVATHSRSNYGATHMTLASMLGGSIPSDPDAGTASYRPLVNDGAVLAEFRDLGYEVVGFSAGFEEVALRRADRFIDSGQLNEFEWELLQLSGLAPVLDLVAPTLLADQHRARVGATLDGVPAVVREGGTRPLFVLAHVLSPHSPQVFGPSGEPVEIRGVQVPFDDSDEYTILGREEYARRLSGQIAYLDDRVLAMVRDVIDADPRAVVVAFSDHGSGIHETADIGGTSDLDLRTANLLAVRAPGHADLIDDRSTLVNVLPRIMRAYAGTGPADVPETIYGVDGGGRLVVFERPD